jgi:outer membrane protein OmpA-like peptidoglycan-associated protein
VLLDSDERLAEQVSLPQVRARAVAEALIGIGISPDIIDVK